MRRFEITLKHLTSIKGELCTRNLWNPVFIPTHLDRDWSVIAGCIDGLIYRCRSARATSEALPSAALHPVDPFTGVRKDPVL